MYITLGLCAGVVRLGLCAGLCAWGCAPGCAPGLCASGFVWKLLRPLPGTHFVSSMLASMTKQQSDKEALILEAAVLHLKSPSQKLKKACRCHLSMGEGHHKANCVFHPPNLKNKLAQIVVQRETLAAQLAKTTMTAGQQSSALEMFFGPLAGSSSASSSSSAKS